VNDLLRRARRLDTVPELVGDPQAPAAIELGGKAAAQVLLPAVSDDGVSIAGFAQLEVHDPVEQGLAVPRCCRVPPTAHERDDPEGDDGDGDEGLAG